MIFWWHSFNREPFLSPTFSLSLTSHLSPSPLSFGRTNKDLGSHSHRRREREDERGEGEGEKVWGREREAGEGDRKSGEGEGEEEEEKGDE